MVAATETTAAASVPGVPSFIVQLEGILCEARDFRPPSLHPPCLALPEFGADLMGMGTIYFTLVVLLRCAGAGCVFLGPLLFVCHTAA